MESSKLTKRDLISIVFQHMETWIDKMKKDYPDIEDKETQSEIINYLYQWKLVSNHNIAPLSRIHQELETASNGLNNALLNNIESIKDYASDISYAIWLLEQWGEKTK